MFMRPENYIPPNVLPRFLQRISFLLKLKWARQLILIPPTLSGRRFSNKTEDYGVFQASRIAHLDQLSIYARNIEKSREWYEKVAGMRHSRTSDWEPHPFWEGHTMRCCYMNAANHEECLVLVEVNDSEGRRFIPSGMSFFHFALELEGNQLENVFAFAEQAKRKGEIPNYGPARHNDVPPHGDGETGGNVAVYFYDPDFNNVEFCGAMDTIANYASRNPTP